MMLLEEPEEMTEEQIGAWKTAASALMRGGQREEPSVEVQVAAMNWVIQQQLAAWLLDAVQSGDHNACLRVEDDQLMFYADGIDGIVLTTLTKDPLDT